MIRVIEASRAFSHASGPSEVVDSHGIQASLRESQR